MHIETPHFNDNARDALKDAQLQKALAGLPGGLVAQRAAARDKLPEFEALRDVGRDLRNETLELLDVYLETYERNATAAGAKVHWAQTAEEARRSIVELCKAEGARLVTKGKSMISEEIGLNDALQDAGIEPDPSLIVKGNLLQQSGLLAVEMLFTRGRPFSAIFAANDQMAFGARLGLYRRNIRVPEDISLVGFDDESSAAYMVPPLTTARQPAAAMGQAAAAAMLALLNGDTVELPDFQAELIIRESVSRRR